MEGKKKGKGKDKNKDKDKEKTDEEEHTGEDFSSLEEEIDSESAKQNEAMEDNPTDADVVKTSQEPSIPQTAKTSDAQISKPSVLQTPKPSVPQSAKPSDAQISKPSVPQSAKPSDAQISKPSVPQSAKPSNAQTPKPSTPQTPKSPPPQTPKPAEVSVPGSPKQPLSEMPPLQKQNGSAASVTFTSSPKQPAVEMAPMEKQKSSVGSVTPTKEPKKVLVENEVESQPLQDDKAIEPSKFSSFIIAPAVESNPHEIKMVEVAEGKAGANNARPNLFNNESLPPGFPCAPSLLQKRSPFIHNPPQPEERRERIACPRTPRDYIINLRENLADFQESHGLPRTRDYSFCSLGFALAQETGRAIFSLFHMFTELFPILAIVSLILRFALDKLIEILETNETRLKIKKSLIFALEMIAIVIPLWILIGTIILPLLGLVVTILKNMLRIKGNKKTVVVRQKPKVQIRHSSSFK